MIVICKKIDAKGIDLKIVTTIFSNEFDYTFAGYGLELHKKYIVMGMAVYNDSNCLYYLIDTNGRPNWFPYLLFDVFDKRLPTNWFVKINNQNIESDIQCLCGFDELCNNPLFYDLLADRNEDALKIYFKKKIELEKEIELNDFLE
jgi:hypothetical protein